MNLGVISLGCDKATVDSERLVGRFVGRETDVLIDEVADPEPDGATHVGRVPWQADDVDGVTRVACGGWARPGDFVRVRLEGNEDYDSRAVALATRG
jgi:tRNA A37 methylthiotransferase MiaB